MLKTRSMNPTKAPMDGFGFSPTKIHEQMERILNSPEFNATNAQRAFLNYVVRKTLARHADEIKGYTVTTNVFGRQEDFDQATDPVVSIQANKLRRALEGYYLVAEQNDPIRIDIPKGAYVPSFQPQRNTTDAATSHQYQKAQAYVKSAGPSPAILGERSIYPD